VYLFGFVHSTVADGVWTRDELEKKLQDCVRNRTGGREMGWGAIESKKRPGGHRYPVSLVAPTSMVASSVAGANMSSINSEKLRKCTKSQDTAGAKAAAAAAPFLSAAVTKQNNFDNPVTSQLQSAAVTNQKNANKPATSQSADVANKKTDNNAKSKSAVVESKKLKKSFSQIVSSGDDGSGSDEVEKYTDDKPTKKCSRSAGSSWKSSSTPVLPKDLKTNSSKEEISTTNQNFQSTFLSINSDCSSSSSQSKHNPRPLQIALKSPAVHVEAAELNSKKASGKAAAKPKKANAPAAVAKACALKLKTRQNKADGAVQGVRKRLGRNVNLVVDGWQLGTCWVEKECVYPAHILALGFNCHVLAPVSNITASDNRTDYEWACAEDDNKLVQGIFVDSMGVSHPSLAILHNLQSKV
jgi:hypothetical protein